jgi:hypothetical protein
MIGRCSLPGSRAAQERSDPATGVLRPAAREGRPRSNTRETNKLGSIPRLRPECSGKRRKGDGLIFFDVTRSRRKVYLTQRLKCLRKVLFGKFEV